MTLAMTSSPVTARPRVLASEQRRGGPNGGHLHVADSTANSLVTKTTAEDQRTTTATRKSGGNGRINSGDGAPAADRDGERADEDGDATATTAMTSPSDDDDWSDGSARN
uniref:Retrotransposon protein, putative, unclassified n=1 Tax=Oryza sativa subsp. japonica TaxID=39947 RepID=Q2QY41_ORYSJ|nr:retrotransposon protein, putative, unclassified [Oryza sativa Japonica Group]